MIHRGYDLCSKVMSHPVTTFDLKDTVGNIIDKLKADPHEGFPVVESYSSPSVVSGAHVSTMGLVRAL